ncbi:elongation factor P--(R)-beta-lysine ligase [Sodalis-like secondary symbiont of Drepanosiphum platanoidis]|uniref:elongation factor P--(R)-beta-lysine ligase n=1 Tax=Sodalis-like secondary symbiont of Drepanosiphum platanoidis TaxID=2994493 RepID=UPI0034643691
MSIDTSWKPTSSIKNLINRAIFIKKIRKFFYKKKYLEVDTPILSKFTVTDAHIKSFKTVFKKLNIRKKLYLITSPEYHMKRLIAANSGPIFQICHSFRNGEIGRLHQPEFTMLEWYNPKFGMQELIKESDELLKKIFSYKKIKKISYKNIYIKYLGIDPFKEKIKNLQKKSILLNIEKKTVLSLNKNELLQLIFSIAIEPNIGKFQPVVVYHFPIEQSLLSKINKKNSKVSNRFEIYFKGIEIANGFQELTNLSEHYKRFNNQNNIRKLLNISTKKIDKYFISALKYGLPSCSGISIGIDRLLMILTKMNNIKDIISFSIENS